MNSVPLRQPAGSFETTLLEMAGLRNQLKSLLFTPEACANFTADICIVGRTLSRLAAQCRDATLFCLLHGPSDKFSMYSVSHAVQCSVAAHLVAERLQFGAPLRDSLVLAGLTMNIGMTQVHSDLAVRTAPPTAEQREVIRNHPEAAVELLRRLGVDDPVWLQAVLEHHESPDGCGYPTGLKAAYQPAEVLRLVDIYLAKLKGRSSRQAVSPDKALREIFAGSHTNPIMVAIVKEFGLYPHGTFVRLVSGEVAIVVAQGEAANKPIVAAIVAENGKALRQPERRDTAVAAYAITYVVDAANILAPVDPTRLFA